MPAKLPNRTATQVRIDAELLDKLKVIARAQARTMNAQLEFYVRQGVEAYEAVNGPIKLPDAE